MRYYTIGLRKSDDNCVFYQTRVTLKSLFHDFLFGILLRPLTRKIFSKSTLTNKFYGWLWKSHFRFKDKIYANSSTLRIPVTEEMHKTILDIWHQTSAQALIARGLL